MNRTTPLTLGEAIQIRQSSTRSINLEYDLSQTDVVKGYLLSAQGIACIARTLDGISGKGSKAWTLTGQYGSGKSFFGLFLGNLLGVTQPSHKDVLAQLEAVAPLLKKRVLELINDKGFLSVAVTGMRSPLIQNLTRGFRRALQGLNGQAPPSLLDSLNCVHTVDSRSFLDWINNFLEVISELKYSGVLVIFDELGKSLEYASNHPNQDDVYLLQEIAELANRSHKIPLVFIGILHQAFEQYASLLNRTTQREWAKVQGRFEDIPFQEPPFQQMRLIARAIEQSVSAKDTILEIVKTTLENVIEAGWTPAMMTPEEFAELAIQAYPLHPSTLVALPYIFRRLAQNERSLFAYLTSQEPFGFQEFLFKHQMGDFLRLPDLFDYLAVNYEGRIYAYGRARPLTEALERLSSSSHLTTIEVNLIKTIGLLNWLSEISPLQTTEARILSALRSSTYSESTLRAGLQSLQRQSLIVYRRFNQTYTVWQGSDIDIEERLQTAFSAMGGNISLADTLQIYLPPRPLVARRHSYQSGALRFFDTRYVDLGNIDKVSLAPTENASGVVLLCLPRTLAEIEHFVRWAQDQVLKSMDNLVIGIAGRAIQISELVQELRGLHWIQENTPELRDDAVARRELRARLTGIEHLIRNELEQALNLHQVSALSGCQWWYQGIDISKRIHRGISYLLSDICDRLYNASPRIHNELINRCVLTSQGAAARRTLIEGILRRSHEPLLGINGFPPERSMYETILRKGGLHRYKGTGWQMTPPDENELQLSPAWQAIYDFIFSTPPEPRPVLQLYQRLKSPPYGVTQGVVPLLLAAFYKCYENEITMYKEGTLLVDPDIPDWEVLLRRPELFSITGCRVADFYATIVERLARGLETSPYVIPVVRSLILRLKALPKYSWQTQLLPEHAKALRRAVEHTRSPEQLLFYELPQALEMSPFSQGEFDQQQFELFFARLNAALQALANATPRLLNWARDTWLKACRLPEGEAGWQMFCQQAQVLSLRVTHAALLPLLKRAAETPNPSAALESVLAFIANRPLHSWSDADAERFSAQAQFLGSLFQQEQAGETFPAQLDHDRHLHAERIAAELQTRLDALSQDPLIRRTALHILLQRLKNDYN
ncbi:MAG: hypothetical protein HPY45_02710 [Anaerolineae bacterium]|nr:hypothetical protein [Anaerolineae bacterium]